MSTKYDVTWWWRGGRDAGQWCPADYGTREQIERGGRVAVDGLRSIGPPEGPPSQAAWNAIQPYWRAVERDLPVRIVMDMESMGDLLPNRGSHGY